MIRFSRLAAVAALTMVPIVGGSTMLANSASAASAPKTFKCSGFTGTINLGTGAITGTFTGCSSKGYKGSVTTSESATSSTTSFKTKGGASAGSVSVSGTAQSAGTGTCKSGDIGPTLATSTVSSAKGDVAKLTGKGAVSTLDVCANTSTGKLYVPTGGTKPQF